MLALEWGEHCEMTKVFMKEEFLLLSARRLIRFFMQVSSKEFVLLVFFVLASLPSRSVQAKHESDTRRRKKARERKTNKQTSRRAKEFM